MNDMIPRISFREIEDCEYVAELLLVEAREIMENHSAILTIIHSIPAQLRGFVQLDMGLGTSPRDLHEFISRHNDHVVRAANMTVAVVAEMRRLRAEKGVKDASDEMYDAHFDQIVKSLKAMNEI